MGRQGQPIYLRDFDAPLLFDIYSQPSATVPDNDFFCDSLIEETEEQKVEWPCRMKYQFALLAAYEKAVQMLEGGWKGVGGAGPDACWMGLVCNVDGFHAYGERCFEGIPSCHNMFNVVIICSSRTILSSRSGYVTTNAKYIILVEDVIPPDDIQLEKSRENELKILLVSKHSETYETSSEPNDSIYSVYSHQYMGFTQTIF